MSFIEEMKAKAKANIKTVVLPEPNDKRVLEAACKVTAEGFAKVILVGNKDEANKVANENGINISYLTIIDPTESEKKDEYANALYELRKEKGMTEEQARELMNDSTHYAMMMVKMGEVAGLV